MVKFFAKVVDDSFPKKYLNPVYRCFPCYLDPRQRHCTKNEMFH